MSKREHTPEPLNYRMLEVRAATINKDERSVECLISTENPVPMYDWERGEVIDEILLTDGAVIPRSRQVPLLNSHMRYAVEDVLGSARSVKKTDEGIIGRLHFSSLAADQFTRVEEGHITDVSAGYRVEEKQFVPRGERHKINGRSYSGPVNVVTKWRLREVSIVPIGADDQAKLRGLEHTTAPVTRMEAPETPITGGLHMGKELRELLVTRGMPADLDDAAALAWLNEHRSEVFPNNPTPGSTTGGGGENRPSDPPSPPPNIEELVRNAVDSAVPQVLKIERERQAKFRAEADQLIEIAGFKGDQALTERCYQCADLNAVRAAILKHREDNTVDVGSARMRPGDHASVEKFHGAIGTALLMRCLDNNEALIERTFAEEVRFGRVTPFGNPEPWNARRERSAGWEQFRNLSLIGLATECLRFEGVDTRYLANWQIAQASLGYYREAGVRSAYWGSSQSMRDSGPAYHTTGSFANITLDAMNKGMLAGYVERPFTWEGPFRRAPSARDFKRIHRVRLGEFPSLEVTPDNHAPNQASFKDEKESYGVEAYSKEISFSWQLLVNDDMDALSRTPRMMGAAANRTVNTFAWGMIEANALLQDGVAWFATATGNRKKDNLIGTGSGAPTLARLQAMRKLMRLQVGVNTREEAASEVILNLEPAYWAVPAALELVARQILFSPFSPDATNSITFNQFNSGNSNLQLIVEPLLDGQTNGATASILFANPSQCDTAEIAFLQGQETPFNRSYMDDKTMAMNWQIWQTFGGKPIDFRGVVRDKGIA